MNLNEIISYLDELLEPEKLQDGFINGLQVENSGTVSEICSGVDICCEIINRSSPRSLILVHHGFLHNNPEPLTRDRYRIISSLIAKDCALYTAHLPLDIHKEYGNNYGFYRLLGWDKYIKEPFLLNPRKIYLSCVVEFPEERTFKEVMEEIYRLFGRDLTVWDFGKKKIKRLAFGSGYAPIVSEPLTGNLDLYITGECAHYCYWQAKDNKLNMIFLGYYNSETTGVRLLGEHLSEKYDLKHSFIDLPTGI